MRINRQEEKETEEVEVGERPAVGGVNEAVGGGGDEVTQETQKPHPKTGPKVGRQQTPGKQEIRTQTRTKIAKQPLVAQPLNTGPFQGPGCQWKFLPSKNGQKTYKSGAFPHGTRAVGVGAGAGGGEGDWGKEQRRAR